MQDVSTWGIKLEALKLVQTFVQFFSKLVGPYLPPLMAQAWQLFVGSQPIYQHLVINNAPDLDADQVFTQCPLAAASAAAGADIKCLQAPHGRNVGSLQESKHIPTCARSYAWSPELVQVHCSEYICCASDACTQDGITMFTFTAGAARRFNPARLAHSTGLSLCNAGR